ncbi:MAG: RHS repeat-associated core domain-containing protein [Candidatus Sphingomonas phytovorans]|nr:RHS repeat-associated core domain-containing protein [Sphingomonas sp.]WEK02357.1 MAG: RHS repeat-associated core domain-containing protein [Sphingomonas sp.]
MAAGGRFQYTGQIYLSEMGMYYYKARIYSSRLGRFLQTDPIGYKDQNNLYAYVRNDPIGGRDPTGSCTLVGRVEYGLCGTSTPAKGWVDRRLQDRYSMAPSLEKELVSKAIRIKVLKLGKMIGSLVLIMKHVTESSAAN